MGFYRNKRTRRQQPLRPAILVASPTFLFHSSCWQSELSIGSLLIRSIALFRFDVMYLSGLWADLIPDMHMTLV